MSESLDARVVRLDDEGLGGAAAAVGLPPFGEEEADETPISPPSGPAPRLLQGPPSKSKFLAASPNIEVSFSLSNSC